MQRKRKSLMLFLRCLLQQAGLIILMLSSLPVLSQSSVNSKDANDFSFDGKVNYEYGRDAGARAHSSLPFSKNSKLGPPDANGIATIKASRTGTRSAPTLTMQRNTGDDEIERSIFWVRLPSALIGKEVEFRMQPQGPKIDQIAWGVFNNTNLDTNEFNDPVLTGSLNYTYHPSKRIIGDIASPHGYVWGTIGSFNETKLYNQTTSGLIEVNGCGHAVLFYHRDPQASFTNWRLQYREKGQSWVSIPGADFSSENPVDVLGCNDDRPELSLVKAAELNDSLAGATGVADAGDVITYTYHLENIGDSVLNNVTVQESAPNFSGAGAMPTPAYRVGSSSMGSPEGTLLIGEKAEYEAQYALTAQDIDRGIVTNAASATAAELDDAVISDAGTDGEGRIISTPADENSDRVGSAEDDPTSLYLPQDTDGDGVPDRLDNDLDGDGIANRLDIDDDNDGVPDHIESPNCFKPAEYWLNGDRPYIRLSTSLALNGTYNQIDKLVDGDAGGGTGSYALRFQDQTSADTTLLTVSVDTLLPLRNIYLAYEDATSHFDANTVLKLQGSTDSANWVDLNNGHFYGSSTTFDPTANSQGTDYIPGVGVGLNAHSFPVEKNSNAYAYYRIYWVSGGKVNNNGTSIEIYLEPGKDYSPSHYPRLNCTDDFDANGKPNHQDLDSDGDGCSDALEAGATTSTSTDFQFGGQVGANGLPNTVETFFDSYELNYILSYQWFALSRQLKACVDTDGDGINDLVDLDDDNDGVLDHIESPGCFVQREEVDLVEVRTSLSNYSTNNSYLFSELYDGVDDDLASVGSNNTLIQGASVYEFVFAQALPVDSFEV
ncbi:MAG: hypothetical protein RI842_05780, partial [Schleiferiaceae bacterium]|nr:hypothetical protein [Schleiferiaceae bacterium]